MAASAAERPREGADVAGSVGPHLAHHAQPREGLDRELDPQGALGGLGAAVVPRLVLRDEAQLADLCLQRGRAHDRGDALGEPDHLGHAGALLGGREVAAHAGADVDGRADVEHPPLAVLEQVDARGRWQVAGEIALAPGGRSHPRGVAAQLLERVHPQAAHPPDEGVQDVDSGAGVVQGPVVGRRRRAEESSEGRELVVARLVARHELAREGHGVEDLETGPGVAGLGRGRLEEGDVEPGVVGHQHRASGELEEGWQCGLDAGCVGDHRIGDAGQDLDERRDGDMGVDQGLELAEHLAAADPHRADLGDVRLGGAPTGGLEVDDDEGDTGESGAQVVERALDHLHGPDRMPHR